MTVNDVSVGRSVEESTSDEALELLTDNEGWWTLVPVAATGEERLTQWISVDRDTLCDLEEWR